MSPSYCYIQTSSLEIVEIVEIVGYELVWIFTTDTACNTNTHIKSKFPLVFVLNVPQHNCSHFDKMMIISKTRANFDFMKKRRWQENAKSYLHTKFHQFSIRNAPVGAKLLLITVKADFFKLTFWF